MRPVALGVRGLTSSPSALARGADHEPPLVNAKRCISWALWRFGEGADPGLLSPWARSHILAPLALGKARIWGPWAPRKGGATLPATLQNLLKRSTCNPLIFEGLQVGLRLLSGAPKGSLGRVGGWGARNGALGGMRSAPNN